jgi:AraC-like DNA-binding protein
MDFKKLVDDTRRRLALHHIKEEKDPLTQIAFMLGYSDASAFNRAFKRWTGTAPLEYRRTLATQARTFL